ncbi:MAG TPA: NAD(P)H-binding protein [Puia sp.]|nr:NAD(P)H-binding protein [Puia sp.]
MKITLTGSLGNISKLLAGLLIRAGHEVTIISSSADKAPAIAAFGASAAIGSVSDLTFLTRAFSGADVVYTMVPPNFGVADYRVYIGSIGLIYADAIRAAGVSRVVNLSSLGAELPGGAGPISGLYDVEQALDALDGVAVRHLRAGFFYYNFFHDVDMIKNMGILGSNYGADTRLLLVHPADIADAASEEVLRPFTGKSIRYVVSDERSTGEIAGILGAAIGKPGLRWVEFSDEQALAGMQQAGMPVGIAKNFVEMGAAVRSGIIWNEYDDHKGAATGKRKFEGFAAEFAEKF